jgi:predicted SprT family Zn-dependent metalloprotease
MKMAMTEKEFIQLVYKWDEIARMRCGLELGSLNGIEISSRARNWLGQCKFCLNCATAEKNCKLVFSKALLQLPTAYIVNTIVHEICHMVKYSRSHDAYWRKACNRMMKDYPSLNLNVTATKEETTLFKKALPKRKVYLVKCPTCSHVWKFYRRCPTVEQTAQGFCTCSKCGTKLIVEEGRE